MKKSKLIISMLCAATLGASISSFVGCGGEAAAETVMNVSMNPEVEFVLDANDKVLSVNAINEDGNIVISADAFANVKGMDAGAAAKLFVQVSKENGFILEGDATYGPNEVSISISGDAAEAEKIYNDVKGKIEAYFSEANITATVSALETMAKEQIQAAVEACAPYLEKAEVQAMEYAELVKTLAESRKETAALYSQELKDAYYEAKALAMEQAEMQVLKDNAGLFNAAVISGLETAYNGAVTMIENTRYSLLVSDSSLYQTMLAAYRSAKVEFLKYREYVAGLEQNEVTTAIAGQLATLESALEKAKSDLDNAAANIDAMLSEYKTTLKNKFDQIVGYVDEATRQAADFLNAVSTKQKAALETFTSEFESKYASAKAAAKQGWADMRVELSVKYNPEA